MTITKTKLAKFLCWAGVITTLCGGSAIFYEICNESLNLFWPTNLLLLGGVFICGYQLITPNKASQKR